MYRALESFTTKNYDVKRKQLLDDDFTTNAEIQEFLNIGYIEVYNSSLEITENGNYDVKDYEKADVNVSGGGGAFEVPDGMKFAQSSALPTTLDTSEVTDMSLMFTAIKTTTIPQIDTSKATTVVNMFSSSTNLTTIPQIDTSKATNAQYFCSNCSSLINVPQLDFSSITEVARTSTNCQGMFSGCPSLSNESLNNILAMCITMNPYSSHKTLNRIGLSSEQATTCQSLSNWNAFVSAGWSTGY